ncbi:MAG: hypothetical protein WB952_20220 [Terriglobales bacterium]
MKVLFLLDNGEYVEVAPEKLQIRQLQEGLAAIGTEVVVPVTRDGITVEDAGESTPEVQVGFRPFINYRVNLSIPQDDNNSGSPDGSTPGSGTLFGDSDEIQLCAHCRGTEILN